VVPGPQSPARDKGQPGFADKDLHGAVRPAAGMIDLGAVQHAQ
jgi:hypothetical protein